MAELAALFPFLGAICTIRNIIAYGFQLKGTSEAARNAKKILERVQRDINILRRLATQRWANLGSIHQHEIQQAILDANEAIIKMAEPVKFSIQNVERHGVATLYRRILWVVCDGDTVDANMNLLHVCHRSILGQITILSSSLVDWQPSLIDESGAIDALPEGVPLREKRIRRGMLEKKALWEAFTDGTLRTNKSTSISTMDDDEERKNELRPRRSPRHRSHLTFTGTGDENALLGVGSASNLQYGGHDHYQDDFDDGIWEEFSARSDADAHRRSKSVDKSPNALDELYAEYNARSEEDVWRRGQMQTPGT